jgi:uncharacterized repeat protein (TIGR01451 family)
MKSFKIYFFTVVFFCNVQFAFAQPQANFSWSATCSMVNFTDLSSCNGCSIVNWFWNFGDGSLDNSPNPVHWFQWSGVYNVSLIITNDNGDTSITVLPVMVDNTGNLSITVDQVNNPNVCGATCDGSISVWASGGNPPYTYIWNVGITTPIIPNLCAGTYTVDVLDGNGCTANKTITLDVPVDIVLDSLININCLDANSTGSIVVHAQGGSGNYSYQWAPVSSSTPGIYGLFEGTYTVVVTDTDNGCTAHASYTISNNSNLYLGINSTPANCNNNGSASVMAQGQHPPFTYLWNDPQNQTSATAVNLAPGNYNVQVTDTIGCSKTVTVKVNTICRNVIKGRVYDDANQNCVQDAGEQGMANVIVYANPGNYYASTNASGDYLLYTPEMNSVVSIPGINPFYSPVCPQTGSIAVSFTHLGDTSLSNDFSYFEDPVDFDLEITASSVPARPGFSHNQTVSYRYFGIAPMNVTVQMKYDPLLIFESVTNGGVHDVVENTIEWTLNNLAPSHIFKYLKAYFTVPIATPIGTLLISDIEILPITGDVKPVNNTRKITRAVTGSYDPNDKAVDPKGEGEDGNILPSDTVLLYNIRFQNTGNDTAFTVVVVDTLSAFLNPATVVPGSSSHPYTFSITDHGILTFRFDQIMLPDSNVNEPESNGYFNFTIHLKPGLPLGTVIENTVGIYFDFNEAIITNTVVNTIALPVAVEEKETRYFTVYPNPATAEINIAGPIPAYLKICNMLGQTVAEAHKTNKLQINNLPPGLYLLQLFDEKGNLVRTEKVIRH